MNDLWTSSRLAAFLRCPRLHDNRYNRGIGEPSSDVARFGTVGHDAIEAGLRWYAAAPEKRMHHALAACDALTGYDRARLRAAIIGYWARWGDEDWEVLAVEVEFRYWLGDVEVGGKIDAIVRRRSTGEVFVVEHKFTSMDSSPGSAYWERLTIDTQVSIYTDGAAALGYDVAGVIYDVIDKPGHKPALATPEADRKYTAEKHTLGKGCKRCGGRAGGKLGPLQGSGVFDGASCGDCSGNGWLEEPKHEPARLYANQRDADESPDDFEARILAAIAVAPDSFYTRGTIVRLEDELPKMRGDILDTIKLARLAQVVGIAPRSTGACAKFGSLCAFFDACSGRADIDDHIRFPRARAHAELGAPSTP